MNFEKLQKAGINYRSGIRKYQNDEELYEIVLRSFLVNDFAERAEMAYEARDMNHLSKVALEAKGVSKQSDFTKAHTIASILQNSLKKKDIKYDEVTEEYENYLSEFRKIDKAIRAALEG